jgi:hypothetical protein
MTRWLWIAAVFLVGLGAWFGVARAQTADVDRYRDYRRALVSGNWSYGFELRGTLTPEGQKVTDYAFGPGRGEIAFLGPHEGVSALWLAGVAALDDAHRRNERRKVEIGQIDVRTLSEAERTQWEAEYQKLFLPYDESPAAPRLLWEAPPEAQLLGPILWSANGSTLLVRARRGESTDLVTVDYATGHATWLTEGQRVEQAAWPPAGAGLAYVTQEGEARHVWTLESVSARPRSIGTGGWNLRWSATGKELRWLAPLTETAWAAMELARRSLGEGGWEGAKATQIGTRPARPQGTTWSPDGRWCAALVGDAEKKLLLWSANSTRGGEVPLPGLKLARVLSWSPDGNLLLVLDAGGALYAVSTDPPAPTAFVTVTAETGFGNEVPPSRARARALPQLPMQPDAGPPAWSADGKWLVYTVDEQLRQVRAFPSSRPEPAPTGRLFALQVAATHVEIHPKLTSELQRALGLQRIKNVGMALQMYLTDYDRMPWTNDQLAVTNILDEYVIAREVFMKPGDNTRPAVTWLFEGGVPPTALGEDWSQIPIAIVDYSPDFHVIAYADGHAVLEEGPAVIPGGPTVRMKVGQ